ncbi:hypothetical protein H0H87_006501 [Tephrocybe sp. NHM501043]|nr:hypothetical protein H0H87_006501 [Tephrocybe sp. NHM501043]
MPVLRIIKKLVALGYEADIASIRQPHSLENQEHVRKPQKLTERIWANIREPVIKFMDEMRAIRLNREHKQLILLRKPAAVSVFRAYMAKHHPFTDLIPSGLDFCAFPLVKEILEQSSEVEVDESSFTDVVPLIPDFITDWRQSLDGHIIQVIKDDPSFLFRHSLWNKFGEFVGKLDKDSYKDDWSLEDHGIHNWAEATLRRRKLLFNESKLPLKLPLATTVFTCKKCNKAAPNETDIAYETDDDDNFAGYSPGSLGSGTYSKPLFYPEVKGHHCLTRKKVFDLPLWLQGHEEYGELLMENPARKLDSNKVWRRRWSTHPLRINRRLEDCARALVKEAGLDPETTTVQDMDNLDTWFACLVCADNCGEEGKKDVDVRPYEMPAFKWRLAMEHFASGHPHSWTQPAWTAIGLDQFDDAVETFKCNPRSSHNKPEGSNNGPRRIVLPVTKDTTWSCVHCRDTPAELPPTSFESITQHLNEKHNLKELEENKDYYKDFAAVSPLPPQQQVIISFSCKEVKKATAFAMSMAFGLSDFGGFFDFDSEPDSDLDEWDGPGFAAGTFMF